MVNQLLLYVKASKAKQYKIFVYRSTNPSDIDTIDKIRTKQPVLIVDETVANLITMPDMGETYPVYDADGFQLGVQYHGPEPNSMPSTEYETQVDIEKINKTTYKNIINLVPLPAEYLGQMMYYTVIGVKDSAITQLSAPKSVLFKMDYMQDDREVWAADDYEAEDSAWVKVGDFPWKDETIAIGKDFVPLIETVPMFTKDDVSIKDTLKYGKGLLTIEIPNIWRSANPEYNMRLTKSFKVRNTYGGKKSKFSVPTWQSKLPCIIERLDVYMQELRTQDDASDIPYGSDDLSLMVCRNGGIYSHMANHQECGVNKYLIKADESTGLFTETSVNDVITINRRIIANRYYKLTFYLTDIYENHSEPVTVIYAT